MADTAKFSALYYPYSRCLREVDLKRMVFIFDEILFVDPLSKDLGLCPGQYPVDNKDMRVRIFQDSDEVYFGDRYLPIKQRGIKENFDLWNWFDIRETYSYLQAEGVVKLIDPVKTIRKNDTLIGYSVVTDMIRGIASTSGTRPYLLGGDVNLLPKWILHHQRIPDIFTEIQKDNLLWQSLLNRQRSREENSIEQDYNVEVYRNLINETIIAKETSNSDRVFAPYEVAYLLILNQALLLCDEYSAHLITDDQLVHSSLLKKCEYLHSEDQNRIIQNKTAADSYQTVVFALNVIGRVLPDSVLYKLSFQQVLSYRRKNNALLARFWDKMTELSNKIERTPYDAGYTIELKRFIETEVVPEVRAIENTLKGSLTQFFEQSASKVIAEAAKTAAPSISTMSLAALLGLTPEMIVLFGASGILSSIGIVLPDFVSEVKSRRNVKKNGLAYLMQFPYKTGL